MKTNEVEWNLFEFLGQAGLLFSFLFSNIHQTNQRFEEKVMGLPARLKEKGNIIDEIEED